VAGLREGGNETPFKFLCDELTSIPNSPDSQITFCLNTSVEF